MVRLLVCLLIINIIPSYCDIYLHNPRGSNNRLNENTRERANPNRLFDSENNNRGGYNVGNLYYYVNSTLAIEWTNQHSCGDQNAHCDLILQYMCGTDVRDGLRTEQIPDNKGLCLEENCTADFRFGMHENYEYYKQCASRKRNGGLFIADKNLILQTAMSTRQNPNAQRYAYECSEERDYYPYWGPSPWKDIAVLTNDVSRCDFYKKESLNVKPVYYCEFSLSILETPNIPVIANTKEECEKLKIGSNGTLGKWVKQESWGIPPPECRETESTRDNHLGNTVKGEPPGYNWTIPDVPDQKCVFRIRYNISTNDYDRWNMFQGMKPELYKKLKFNNETDANSRGYIYQNNPKVQVFKSMSNFKLNLNVNTNQFGRVFQDRSHVFQVKSRPKDVASDVYIQNINVRGKRGNIVQVYPAVEYDFVPRHVHTTPRELVHIQWTGSNTNPNNNDGQGLAGTDRSNIIMLNGSDMALNVPHNHYHALTVGGLDALSTSKLALLSPEPQLAFSQQLLNDAGTYFDYGLAKITSTGIWNYMCTRNNNFSNRSQKGRLVCSMSKPYTHLVGKNAALVELPDNAGQIALPTGALPKLTYLQVEMLHDTSDTSKTLTSSDSLESLSGDTWFTSFLVISEDKFQNPVTVSLKTPQSATKASDLHVYRTDKRNLDSSTSYWVPIPLSSLSSDAVTFQTERGGVYAIRGYSAKFPIVELVVGLVAGLALVSVIVFIVILYRRKPQMFEKKLRYIKRSFNHEV